MKIEIAGQNEVVGCSDKFFKKFRELGKELRRREFVFLCCSWSINFQQTKLFISGFDGKRKGFEGRENGRIISLDLKSFACDNRNSATSGRSCKTVSIIIL